MAIPKFTDFFLPTLKIVDNGNEISRASIISKVADLMNFSEEDRNRMLPSGNLEMYKSRVGWAITYLKKANLLENIQRGVYKITKRGEVLLSDNPENMSMKTLAQFKEFQEFQQTSSSSDIIDDTDDRGLLNPDEQIENSWNELYGTLVSDLKEELHKVSPGKFEYIVVNLLEKMGYGGFRVGAGRVTGGTADQ